MNSTTVTFNIQSSLKKLLIRHPQIEDIVDLIEQKGGRSLLVGGAVRDLVLGVPTKDLDIEVHGISCADLETILSGFGPVRLVGKSFGVLKVDTLDFDWSLPRTDGPGRKPTVIVDPHLGITEAFRRRDLTMNAMGIDLKTFELLDPFNGLADIKNKILRSPDITFFEQDPLRLYRVMQFIGRFDMLPDNQLENACKSMDVSGVSWERIGQEIKKLLLKSKAPSKGLRWLCSIGKLFGIMPELAVTEQVKQRSDYHPEGNLFEHLMQSLDAAVVVAEGNKHEKLTLLWAALLHDIGKVTTTELVDGVLRSHGHAQAGVTPGRKLLKRLRVGHDIIRIVTLLVKYHMHPANFLESDAGAPAYKRLAYKLAPYTTIRMLARLFYADRAGRNGNGSTPLTEVQPEVDQFVAHASKYGVLYEPEKPVVLGKDLINHISPGLQLGHALERAYEIQIEKGVTDKQELIKRVLQGM